MNSVIAVAAAASIGSVGTRTGEPYTTPGLYDREVEWILGNELSVVGSSPSWEMIAQLLSNVRQVIIAEMICEGPPSSARQSVRRHAIFETGYGHMYPFAARNVARCLIQEMLKAEVQNSRTISELASLLDHVAEGMGDRYRNLWSRIPFHQTEAASDFVDAQRAVMDAYPPAQLVAALSIGTALPESAAAALLFRGRGEPSAKAGSGTPPLLEVGSGRFVVTLPRRLTCDFVDLLDNLIESSIALATQNPGPYRQARASTVDRIVADCLERILPGSKVYVGQHWLVDGALFERDVVVFFEDIAICVETKAPRYSPGRRGWNDPAQVLKAHISKAVAQTGNLADAIEQGRASLANGDPIPTPVRRVYRVVATLNSWWGLDMRASDLIELGVMKDLDAALLTSADKFILYDLLFGSPSEFLGYLDHRLTQQRRGWLRISDEYEAIGTYFTDYQGAWHQRPGDEITVFLKPVFQADVDSAVASLVDPIRLRPRPPAVTRKLGFAVREWLSALEKSRPLGWLQAASVLIRLPLNAQRWIGDVLSRANAQLQNVQIHHQSHNQVALILIKQHCYVNDKSLARLIQSCMIAEAILVVELSSNILLAARGLDDEQVWLNESRSTTSLVRILERFAANTRPLP